VALALSEFGFKQADMQEGWALIHALGKGRLLVARPAPLGGAETLRALDAWENRWFPIAHAALGRRFPAVAALFFLNLTQTEGPGVAISVRVFVDRYDELAAGSERYGADASRAADLLRQRGLTAAVVDEAKALYASLTHVAEAPESLELEAQQQALSRAEAAMWAWYLEWSKIARVAIKQRSLLRQLGFLATRRGEEDDQDEAAPPA
jgi:hypothetical protein